MDQYTAAAERTLRKLSEFGEHVSVRNEYTGSNLSPVREYCNPSAQPTTFPL